MVNKQLQRAVRNIRRKGPFLRGLLGDFSGTVAVSGRPGYFYVRVEKPGGYEVGIFPGRVRALNNLPVRIETHPVTGVQFIAGADDETIAYGGTNPSSIPAIELHALTHGWGGDDMLMWLHTMQIFPLRCQPHDTLSTSVVIQAGTYYSEGVFCVLAAPLIVDLSSYVPVSGHKYTLLYLDSTGAAGVQDDDAQLLADLQPAPAGTFWVAAVRLAAGVAIGWQSIIDLRFLNSGVVNGGELELGTDYIVVGTGHPYAVDAKWIRIGTTDPAHWNICRLADLYGLQIVLDENGTALFVEHTGDTVHRVVLSYGGRDDIPFVLRRCKQGEAGLDVLTVDTDGNLTPADTALFDGIDVSEHDHGTAGGEPVHWVDLVETPATFAGQAEKRVAVKADETGLEFVAAEGAALAITFQARYWTVAGALSVADEQGGVWRITENFMIHYVSLYVGTPGASGSTIIDCDYSRDGGATWTTLFTTAANRPELDSGATDKRAVSVPDVTLLYAGDLVRLNIDQAATGAADLSAQIDGEVHQMSPTLYAITLTVADTEYSQVLPVGLRALSFKARTSAAIRWAFESGKVATPTDPYETLAAGQPYWKENLVAASVTLYLASSTAGTVVEVEVWA